MKLLLKKINYLNNIEINTFDEYFNLQSNLLHESISNKSIRIFDAIELQQIKNTSFFNRLYDYFGNFSITNEESQLDEEIYWRIVRPKMVNDVGPLHADLWFWTRNSYKIGNDDVRIKVWIMLYGSEPGFNLISNSHLIEYNYELINVDGKHKPLKSDADYGHVEGISTKPGSGIIFNDRLIHGGNVGNKSGRVSFEFTICVNRNRILELINK